MAAHERDPLKPLKESIFERCRRMSSSEAARRLGIEVVRKGKQEYARCPFHADKTPSLAFYEDGNWYCYGCHQHGDAVDFVSRLKGIKPREAARWLLEGLAGGPLPALVARENGIREALDRTEGWFDQEVDVACVTARQAWEMKEKALAEILAEGKTEDDAWQDARFYIPLFVHAKMQERIDQLSALDAREMVRACREETLRRSNPAYLKALLEEEGNDVSAEE